MGWYDAFRVASGQAPDRTFKGKLFTDADVYKLMEALAWDLAQRPDPAREQRFAEITELIAAAQEDDGYLNTFYGPQGRDARYTDLAHGHELYCAGHLFQAAVARLRAGKDDKLVSTAIALADRLYEDYAAGLIASSDGHPEIEVGLIELARATGDDRYRDFAKQLIETRGHQTFEHHAIGHEYYLDDIPVRDAEVLRGHVVRAMYLTAAVVDLATDTDDAPLLETVQKQWENTWARRTHITGGMGTRHLGESFGSDFELTPDRAYNETCGAVGAIMVAWRLLLATGESHYADAIERLLYNMVATSPNAEGDRFFYVNPLLAREPAIAVEENEAPFRKDTQRANWFWVACCPTNVVRMLASLPAYFATVDGSALTLQQYSAGKIETLLEDGRTIRLAVTTEYPWDGTIRLGILETTGEWTLRLRVPEWAHGAHLTVNGEREDVPPGYTSSTRTWNADDEVVLHLPMKPRVVVPDDRINALRGTVAVERGPLVYCVESLTSDPDAVDLDRFRLNVAHDIEERPAHNLSDVAVALRARGVLADETYTDQNWPYQQASSTDSVATTEAVVELIPYYAWSNRGSSTMRVWIPTL
jgi:hypothetical protein